MANEIVAIDANALPWEERFNEHLGKTLYRKNLITDPDTGTVEGRPEQLEYWNGLHDLVEELEEL